MSPVHDRPRAGPRPLDLAIVAATLSLIAVLWAGVIVITRQDAERAVQDVMRGNANLARAFEEHTVRTLNYVDQIALLVKAEYEEHGPALDLSALLRGRHLNEDLIRNILVSDERGWVTLGAPPVTDRVYLGDREHVRVHEDPASTTLFLSRPILGRVNRKWSMVATRRINKRDGSFGGVVGIAVNPFYFSNFYRDLDLGEHSAVALIGRDGIVRARLADTGHDVGQDIRGSALFRRLDVYPHGSHVARASVDGVRRIFSYRSVREYPLVVSVGTAEDAALADVRRHRRYYYLGAGCVSVAGLAAAGGLIRLGRRETRAAARLQEEQAAYASRLEREVRARTRELEARNAELDGFVHSVSHDLKAPLVALDGMTEILLEVHGARLDAGARHYLGRIRANILHMEDLIRDLLSLSQIGREAHVPEAVPLDGLVDAFLTDHGQAIRARGIKVIRRELHTVRAVRTQMERLVANLLGNALKYLGEAPSPTVEVGTIDRGQFIECFVADNGIGIDPAHHQTIFEPFHRLKEIQADGTGIGLAIVRKIVEGAGGRVWVESARGQGATFRFTWPKASDIGTDATS